MLFRKQHGQLAELVQLDLRKVDIELLADLQNSVDNAVGELHHFAAQLAVRALLASTADEQ